MDCDDGDPLSYPGAEETCDGADNNCDGVVDDCACEVPVPNLDILNSHAYSVLDLDFDADGTAYLTQLISGQDRMIRVEPNGNPTSLNGISNWDMGYGAVSPDGVDVVAAYSTCACSGGGNGLGLLVGETFQRLLVAGGSIAIPVSHNNFPLYGPTDPVWVEGGFVAGNVFTSGDLIRFDTSGAWEVLATLGGPPTTLAVIEGEAAVYAAVGAGIHRVDLDTGEVQEVALLDETVFSLAASCSTGRLYAETTAHHIVSVGAAGGEVQPVAEVEDLGFIEAAPDGWLYRVVGYVDRQSIVQRVAPL